MDNPSEETPLAEPTPEAVFTPEVEEEEPEETDTFHSRKNVLRLASWANIFAWLVVVVYLILFIARLYFDFQQGFEFSVITALGWLVTREGPVWSSHLDIVPHFPILSRSRLRYWRGQ